MLFYYIIDEPRKVVMTMKVVPSYVNCLFDSNLLKLFHKDLVRNYIDRCDLLHKLGDIDDHPILFEHIIDCLPYDLGISVNCTQKYKKYVSILFDIKDLIKQASLLYTFAVSMDVDINMTPKDVIDKIKTEDSHNDYHVFIYVDSGRIVDIPEAIENGYWIYGYGKDAHRYKSLFEPVDKVS